MSLHLIVGCMFSGKTTELIRLINRERSIHRNVLILNSKLDDRYKSDSICSHNQESVRSISLIRLLDLHDGSYGYANTIIIDEAQFFDDLYDFVMKGLSDNKRMIVSGLNGDSNQKSFGDIIVCIHIWIQFNILRHFVIFVKMVPRVSTRRKSMFKRVIVRRYRFQ